MQVTQPFLVYRDRIGAASEIGFLKRQYIGFTRLQPVWTGRTLLPAAPQIGDHLLRLGGNGPLGPLRRLLFRQFGWTPAIDWPSALPTPQTATGMSQRDSASTPGARTHDLAPVLHAQFARGGALALPLARALNLRMVVTLHGGDISKRKNWQGTLLSRRWPALIREASCFVCVSCAIADLAAAKGVPMTKLQVLPIGVEAPARLPAGKPAFHLFVGRFVEKKGIRVLAAAMRRLRAEGDATPLACVGDGPLRPLLNGLARDVSGITVTGWLSPEAVRARMANAYALVVPSVVASDGDAEGLPSVIPEAMAQGCPVIGSDQGGVAEAIKHGQTGFLVPPDDAEALASAMRQIAQDASLRSRLRLAGFNEVTRTLNAALQSAKLETLLLSA